MGIVGAAMNRDTSFIAELGFYIFTIALILFSIFLIVSYKKVTKKVILIIASVPLTIYFPFFVYYISTHDLYF